MFRNVNCPRLALVFPGAMLLSAWSVVRVVEVDEQLLSHALDKLAGS